MDAPGARFVTPGSGGLNRSIGTAFDPDLTGDGVGELYVSSFNSDQVMRYDGATGAQYAMVTVQTHRAVSNAVAQKLGVRHETPQALLIRDGKVVWSASHFRVTAAAVEDAIRNQS